MDQSAITVRYAKAIFELAKEKNLLATLKEDIEMIASICKDSTEFILLLESPIIKTSKKTELITSIFNEKVHPLTLNFLNLITQNKREIHIPGICRNFLAFTRRDQNIKSAVLTTASEIDTKTIKKIEQLMEKELGAKIELSTQINTKIIGGIILRLEDKQYDASVATQLKKIKQNLLETELKN
ncbi:MAG: ATP synthase F1 subunit delta [Prolixibacteraceae bacterium]|nr:ATP synthase F1 subunit delta [Prolixibacteraceae bacterium]